LIPATRVWSLADDAAGAPVATLEGHMRSVSGVAFAPAGDVLTCLSSSGLIVWRPAGAAAVG
jgi:WD40 repeat protein